MVWATNSLRQGGVTELQRRGVPLADSAARPMAFAQVGMLFLLRTGDLSSNEGPDRSGKLRICQFYFQNMVEYNKSNTRCFYRSICILQSQHISIANAERGF